MRTKKKCWSLRSSSAEDRDTGEGLDAACHLYVVRFDVGYALVFAAIGRVFVKPSQNAAQRDIIALRMRAVVDLPTATEPAMPMMKGLLASERPKKRRVDECSVCADST